MTEKTKLWVCIALFVLLFGFFFVLPSVSQDFRAWWNGWHYDLQKVDDATNYKTLKKVEDTCRAMMSSYQADKLTYEQYKDGNDEQRSWADQAKMRANKTASTYNLYILENEFVWAGNVPKDIHRELAYLE